MNTLDNIAIFPLRTVLFPGGVQALRVFEPRYTDMVRECVGQSKVFAIHLIRSGEEVGSPAEPETIGCLASISDWDMERVGVLSIRCVGTSKSRIVSTEVQKDGLLRAKIDVLPEAPKIPLGNERHRCRKLLERVIEQYELNHAEESRLNENHGRQSSFSPFERPYQFDDTGWVANRLAELLPIDLRLRQRLLELDDPKARLEEIDSFLESAQVFKRER